VRPVHVTKRSKKRKNERQRKNLTVANWLFAETTHVVGSKSDFELVGGLEIVVLLFEFHRNRLSGFAAVGGRNVPIPTDLAIGLYNSLPKRTSRETCLLHTSGLITGWFSCNVF